MTLADCDVQAFQAGGKGGQHQNHSNTGVRITHRASGAVGVSREERSQLLNKRKAFKRMAETGKFRAWINRQVWENGRDMEAEVRRTMQPHNLLIEGRTEDRWQIIG